MENGKHSFAERSHLGSIPLLHTHSSFMELKKDFWTLFPFNVVSFFPGTSLPRQENELGKSETWHHPIFFFYGPHPTSFYSYLSYIYIYIILYPRSVPSRFLQELGMRCSALLDFPEFIGWKCKIYQPLAVELVIRANDNEMLFYAFVVPKEKWPSW